MSNDPYDKEWEEYRERGLARAKELGSRGPARYDENGLAPDIVEAFQEHGFYTFENMVSQTEVDELVQELDAILDNAPTRDGGATDEFGRPCQFPEYFKLARPLNEAGARNGLLDQVDQNVEDQVVVLLSHPLMYMDSTVRLYGHPKLLRMVEGLNGPDFVPFNETIHLKVARTGAATAWHQDGRTHWDDHGRALETTDLGSLSHGINASVCISAATPENCLWAVPGSHKSWYLHDGGEFPPIRERLADAVPMTLNPGDIGVVSRSSLHGSYPNRSPQQRTTILLGFHRRSSAIGTTTRNAHASINYSEAKVVTYDDVYVNRRSRIIPLAINARQQRYPDETPYEYRGITDGGSTEWNEQSAAEMRQEGDEYWRRNISL
ncbi:MAG: phytanoyl-CoA dioxygenase family protein [Pseudomonadota bacterium]|nr:phytanoyl-CoA dioxygenase family protein [Pseudomonadota bacterium]